MKNYKMRRLITASSNMTRKQYMDAIEDILNDTGNYDLVESILYQHGAAEDDSDPEEGYYVTMSDIDIEDAYNEILSALSQDSPNLYYARLKKRSYGSLNVYEKGFVDGYEAAQEDLNK